MVQKHLLNLYPARTAWMLSGARRVAMLLVMLLTLTAQTAWAQSINIHVLFTFGDHGNLDDATLDSYENGGLSVTVNDLPVTREGDSNFYTATSSAGQKNTISVELPNYLYVSNATYNYIDSNESPVENAKMTYEGSEYKWSFTIAEDAISSQKRNVDITINIGDVHSKYIVFFDANGGTGAMEYLIMNPFSTQNLPTCTFSRDGYTFLEWETSPSGSVVYADNAEITAGEFGTQTLYAKWLNDNAEMNTYTVTLNQQEGSGGTESVTATYGAAMPAITVPTKTGYDFDGYYTETNGDGVKYYNYDGSSTCTWNITDNTTLYANWTAKQYTVTLDQQGGSGGTTSVNATYASAMPEIELPTKTGYDFDGYYTETNGGGTQYYNADGSSTCTWNITDNTTLYAKWTAKQYTVALDHEGGSGGSDEVTATYGAAMPAITLPTKTGYTFGGYFTEPCGNGTQYYNADGSSARPWDIDNYDAALHAHWKKLLTNDDITIEIPAQTYNGSELTPVVTVKDNGSEVSDEHYTITLPEGRTNAGNYTIEILAKEGSTAYFGGTQATFTISKAPLTVTANDHTISYGDEAENDGVTYSGFVNSEDESVLEGTLEYAYKTEENGTGEDYTTSSPAGTYYIIPSGLTSDNYAITFVPGKLTVNPFTVPLFAANSSNLWMTWCDKYDYEKPEGVTVYTVSGVENNTVTLEEVSDVIPAYTPVLLYREAAGDDAVTATFSAVGTAPASGYDSSSGIVEANLSNNVTLYGNSGDGAYASGDNNIFAVSESSAIQSYVLLDGQFVLVDNDEGISAHRCWLNVTKSTTNGARLLSINTDSESTGIETTNFTNSANSSGAWYGIDGRKLDGKPTKKGLYIYNGKKQVIK